MLFEIQVQIKCQRKSRTFQCVVMLVRFESSCHLVLTSVSHVGGVERIFYHLWHNMLINLLVCCSSLGAVGAF